MEISRVIEELEASGVFIVAAAGNENTRAPVYPAALPGVVAVTALSSSGRKASYANYGSWVDLSAPGGDEEDGRPVGLYSAIPGEGGEYAQGSSLAAPIISGLAGLILSLDPGLTGAQLRHLLLGSAQINIYDRCYANGYNAPFGPQASNFGRLRYGSALLGRGLVNLPKALKAPENSEQMPLQSNVTSCGLVKIGAGEGESGGVGLLLLIIALPILIVVIGWVRKPSISTKRDKF